MEQSFAALQEYFSPSRQHENTSNPAQLVLFAEHALKVKLALAQIMWREAIF